MSDPYVYPGTQVLRNRLGIKDAAELNRAERLLVAQRVMEGAPAGAFDLDHLRAIHRHLFQDVYAWAGEVRTTSLGKGGQSFQGVQHIDTGFADVHRRIVGMRFLRGLDHDGVAQGLGRIVGDINFVHPFREGNGRTQLQFARQLADGAGFALDVTGLSGPEWVHASREANDARYEPMAKCFRAALRGGPDAARVNFTG